MKRILEDYKNIEFRIRRERKEFQKAAKKTFWMLKENEMNAF